ncbi:MAG TPA: carbohydrate kinase [Treponema sp.]|nr:carbohydrate kinase [Treponema sp.]
MKKEFDVVALGELLIDFTSSGISDQGNQLFEANPGGAPCNVLAMLQKLGRKTAFIGKVGKDQFGVLLAGTLRGLGIDTRNLMTDPVCNTTLAFVHTAPDGDRSFSFYRKPGADMMLNEDDIGEDLFRNARLFHFGTLSMTHEGVREATKKAVALAQKNHLTISFDPNLRPPLWDSLDEAKEQMQYGISVCDILKISDDELSFVTGCAVVEDSVNVLRKISPARLILVTMGKKGSQAFCNGVHVEKKTFSSLRPVDTTGAGDTFCGCALDFVLDHDLDNLESGELADMLLFANAAASIVTTRKGALRVMPERSEIESLLDSLPVPF